MGIKPITSRVLVNRHVLYYRSTNATLEALDMRIRNINGNSRTASTFLYILATLSVCLPAPFFYTGAFLHLRWFSLRITAWSKFPRFEALGRKVGVTLKPYDSGLGVTVSAHFHAAMVWTTATVEHKLHLVLWNSKQNSYAIAFPMPSMVPFYPQQPKLRYSQAPRKNPSLLAVLPSVYLFSPTSVRIFTSNDWYVILWRNF